MHFFLNDMILILLFYFIFVVHFIAKDIPARFHRFVPPHSLVCIVFQEEVVFPTAVNVKWVVGRDALGFAV